MDRAAGHDDLQFITSRRGSSWATPAKPGRGSTTCERCSRPTLITSWAGSLTGFSSLGRRSTTASCWAAPRTGKDTLLEPVKHAVGPWNVARSDALTDDGSLQRLCEIGDPARSVRRATSASSIASASTNTLKISPRRRPTRSRSMKRTCVNITLFNVLRLVHHHKP